MEDQYEVAMARRQCKVHSSFNHLRLYVSSFTKPTTEPHLKKLELLICSNFEYKEIRVK